MERRDDLTPAGISPRLGDTLKPDNEKQHDHAAGNGASLFTSKASASLKNHETDIIKKWLTTVIDDLGLISLQSFPTQELSTGFPELIDYIVRTIKESPRGGKSDIHLDEISARLATLRREGPALEKMLDDYALLKRLLVDAAVIDLRKTDLAAIQLSQKIDEGFNNILKAGIEAYVEKNSIELEHLANTDALTGLYNVRYFRRQLHRNLEMYKRYRVPFALMMLDLDNLKELNDALGHNAGDSAIRHLASVMSHEKRETDIAVRYGGDEFFLLLPGTSTDEAERLGHRVSQRVRHINLMTSGKEITGVSIGVVSCPADGTDVGALRSKADRALYLAKSIGGATVARYRDFA